MAEPMFKSVSSAQRTEPSGSRVKGIYWSKLSLIVLITMQILLLQKAVVINSTNSGSVLCDLLKCLLGNKRAFDLWL